MKKIANIFIVTLFLLIGSVNNLQAQSLDNLFLCSCTSRNTSGDCIRYEPNYSRSDEFQCQTGYEPSVAACSNSSFCNGTIQDCEATCELQGSSEDVDYGDVCNPDTSNCGPAPDTSPSTCRESSTGTFRCLLGDSAVFEGRCVDLTECQGYSEGARCVSGLCTAPREIDCNETPDDPFCRARGECNSFSQIPTDLSTQIYFFAENCTSQLIRDSEGRPISGQFQNVYYVRIYDETGRYLFNTTLTPDGTGNYVNTSPFTMHRAGTYSAELFTYNRTDPSRQESLLHQLSFTVEEEDVGITPDLTPEVEPPSIQLCLVDGTNQGFPTPFGCVPFDDPNVYTIAFVSVGIGFAGLIALALLSISAFMIMTSSGEPRRMQQGKELLTSAVIGLIMITLSVLIMRILGGSLLGLF